jgi:4-amino-4-deoxy-L-arabinose transferase-like glycosyltransferase
VVPGIALAYLLCAPGSWRRRIVHLLAAGAVMAVTSLAWLTAVDLTPASQRPFVGSTTSNSEYALAFDYNGFGRVGGQLGGPNQRIRLLALPNGKTRVVVQHVSTTPVARHGPTPFGGATGPLRVFGIGLGDQGGWVLPLGLLGLVAILLTVRGLRDRRLALALVMGGWMLAEVYVLDFGKGIIHPYYVSALGPGLAAMIGAGVAAMVTLVRRGHPALRFAVPILAVALTIAAERSIMHRFSYHYHWIVPIAAAAAIATAALVGLRRWAPYAAAALLAVLVLAPAAYSTTVWHGPVNGTFPAAGANNAHSDIPHGRGRTSTGANAVLLRFLSEHAASMKYQLFAQDSLNAAPLILAGERVSALAGYNGSDPALSPQALAQLIATGQARYIELGGAFSGRGGNATVTAIRRLCGLVPPGRWGGPTHGLGSRSANGRVIAPKPVGFIETGIAVYDCKGHEAALAAAPGFNQ